MKQKIKNTIFFIYVLFCAFFTKAQNGLEDIIVEKYYISNANDTAANSIAGSLPVGSTTYRIYVDMLPGYKFQAAYGSLGHELRITTSTYFFNNEDRGNTIPNVIPQRTLKQNTVMLDSWLSVGAAAENYFGILKQDDDTIETIIHEKQFLQNNNPQAGSSLKSRDGLLLGDDLPRPTFFGIDSAAMVFNNQNKGSFFSTSNGAWACLGGAVGPDSLKSNRVLIAQITTNGIFSFELNIQIGTPTPGISEKYVAKNPVENEILIPNLIYSSKPQKNSVIKKSSKNKSL